MKRQILITGLDIGSSKVAAVVARLDDDGSLNVIAHTTQPSKGILKGAYADLDAAVDCVSKAMEKLRKKLSKNIGDIYVNISGQTVKGERSKGMVALSLRGREVTRRDIDKCVDAASTIKLPFGREIIHRIVRNFSVDDEAPIKNPIGLYASRLGCEVYIISSSTNHIQNIYKCVNLAGYDVKGLVFTGIADGAALLSREEKDGWVSLIDMGAALTEVSIFAGGSLVEAEIAPVGVENLKGEFKNNSELNNLLSGVNSKIGVFSKYTDKPFSVAVTGGVTFKEAIMEFLEEKISCPIKIAAAKDIKGDMSSMDGLRLSTAIGLAKYACEKQKDALPVYKNITRRISSKFLEIFNGYF